MADGAGDQPIKNDTTVTFDNGTSGRGFRAYPYAVHLCQRSLLFQSDQCRTRHPSQLRATRLIAALQIGSDKVLSD